MHVVVRRYKGSAQAVAALEGRGGEIEQVIRGVPGFVAYHLIRTTDGIASVTVCEARAGTDESTQRAAAWVRENLPAGSFEAPEITEGESFIHFTRST